MARTRRIKKDGDGHYHVMSRTNGKAFLFKSGRFKTRMVELLKISAEFSGVRLLGYSILTNHFHALVDVVKPDEPLPEKEILRRIAVLKGNRYADMEEERWSKLRHDGQVAVIEVELEKWRRRMHDVSEFVKTYKELVSIAFKRETEHCGSIWSGRFTSTLVEGGRYLAVCRRYIELNPVRAGLARQSAHYEWCSAGDASFSASTAGSVPEWEGRMMARVVQIGAGKIFGSREFVEAELMREATRGLSPRAQARGVYAEAYASHGWKLAAKAA